MAALRETGIVLEICPTSNLLTKALADEDAVRETFRTFVDGGVQFTIATDGPEMMRTHLRDEFELLTPHRRARRGRGPRGEPPRARGELRPRRRRPGLAARKYAFRSMVRPFGAGVASRHDADLHPAPSRASPSGSARWSSSSRPDAPTRRSARASASLPAPPRHTPTPSGRSSACRGGVRSRLRIAC